MLLPPPRTPDTEPTLTTSPCPLASSIDRQARTVANGPRRLTASTKSKKSSSRARRSACGITRVLPALLTRMSSRPSIVPIASARASIARVSCAGARQARWPAPGRLWISCSAASASLAKVTTTRAPASAKSRAVAAPRPLLPPVTSATRPSSMSIASPSLRPAVDKRPRSIVGRQRRRRVEGFDELDQIGLPHFGIEMGEMTVGLLARRDQDIAPVANPLHRPLDGAEFRRIGFVLFGIDQQHFGLDRVEVGFGVIVHDRLDRPQRVVGVASGGLSDALLVELVGRITGRRQLLDARRTLGAQRVRRAGPDVMARVFLI